MEARREGESVNILASLLLFQAFPCLASRWILGWGLSSWWQFSSWWWPSCQVEEWRKRRGQRHPSSTLPELWGGGKTHTDHSCWCAPEGQMWWLISKNKKRQNLQAWTVMKSLASSVEWPMVSFTWPVLFMLSAPLKTAEQTRQCGEEKNGQKKNQALNEKGEEMAHIENVFLCLMSRWEGTHLGMTSSPLISPSASLRHATSWVSKICRGRNNSIPAG